MASDPLDNATELEEFFRQQALARRKPVLPATGKCHNCAEPVSAPARFCDSDCRDDYELRNR